MISKILQGKSITNIMPINGLVTGQKKSYELWTQGGIISFTETQDVKEIDNIIAEVAAMNKKGVSIDVKDYLLFEIAEGRLDNL